MTINQLERRIICLATLDQVECAVSKHGFIMSQWSKLHPLIMLVLNWRDDAQAEGHSGFLIR